MADRSLILRDESVQARFWAKVDKRGPSECWPWRAAQNRKGYGQFAISPNWQVRAHRFTMECEGVNLDGLVVDHMCRNRLCVNPAHLRAVTQHVNSTENSLSPAAFNSQKTHCDKGHEFAAHGIVAQKGNGVTRICKICRREHRRAAEKRHYDAKRAEQLEALARIEAARWEAVPLGDGKWAVDAALPELSDKRQWIVFGVSESTARLIASAPELLEALTQLRNVGPGKIGRIAAIAKADAAINRAKDISK